MMRAALFTVLAGLTGLAAAADAPEKAAVCAACHGATGVSEQPMYPNLAGQYANYLEHALTEYRSGARKNAVMAGFATTLSDQDIDDLSAYFAAQPGGLQDLSHYK